MPHTIQEIRRRRIYRRQGLARNHFAASKKFGPKHFRIHVKRIGGEIVGWAALFCIASGPDYWTLMIYVRREHRRKGIGTKLCHKLLEKNQDCKPINVPGILDAFEFFDSVDLS